MTLASRLTCAMVGLVFVTATTVGYVAYRNLEAAILPAELARLEVHVRQKAEEFNNLVRSAGRAVAGFAGAAALDGLMRARQAGGIDPDDGVAESVWRERLARRFATELNINPNYLQFRFIEAADGGRELVRVDRTGGEGAVRIVPDHELQAKGDTEYFREGMQMPAGGIYVSRVQLNREQNEVSVPHLPVVRVAAVVSGPGGARVGLLVINLDLRPYLQSLREAVPPGGHFYLVDHAGNFLLHPDPARGFGFEFDRPVRIGDELPGLAARLESRDRAPQPVRGPFGETRGVAFSSADLSNGRRITLIEMVPEERLLASMASVRRSSLLAGTVVVVGAVALALLLARSFSQPLVRMKAAVEAFSAGRKMEVPVEAAGELGVLARALQRMSEDAGRKGLALRESQERIKAIVDTAVEGIVTIDVRGRIESFNPAAEKIFGYTEAEIVGSNVSRLMPGHYAVEHDDYLANYLRTGERKIIGIGREVSGLRRDGTTFPMELAVTEVMAGGERKFAGFVRDITERARAESALRESEERYRLLVEQSPEVISLVVEGRIEFINPAGVKLYGATRAEDLIGRSPMDLIHEDSLAFIAERNRRLAQGLANPPAELKIRCLDGRIVYVESTVIPFVSHGRPAWQGVARDVTARKRAEEELRRLNESLELKVAERTAELTTAKERAESADRVKSDFLATMSHELRTPLNAIIGFTGTLLMRLPGPLNADQEKQLRTVQTSARHLLALINDVLDVAKIEAGRRELFCENVDCERLVQDVGATIRSDAEAKRLALHLELPHETIVAHTDHRAVRQILLNLAGNAVKFTEKGSVTITLRRSGDDASGEVVFVVRDTGIGIRAEQLGRLFQPFVQADSSLKRRADGTGLGLYLSRELAHLLGGRITVTSEPGRGSTFTLLMPVQSRRAPGALSSGANRTSPPSKP